MFWRTMMNTVGFSDMSPSTCVICDKKAEGLLKISTKNYEKTWYMTLCWDHAQECRSGSLICPICKKNILESVVNQVLSSNNDGRYIKEFHCPFCGQQFSAKLNNKPRCKIIQTF